MVIHLSRLRISPPPSLPLLHVKDLGTGTSKTPLLFEGLAKGGKDRLHNLPCRFLPEILSSDRLILLQISLDNLHKLKSILTKNIHKLQTLSGFGNIRKLDTNLL